MDCKILKFPFHSELPDLSPYGGVYFSIGVAIDPTLTRGFYYACCEPERLMLRDVENDMNLWEVDILTDVVDAVILSPWRWSPDGELIAFTFATDMTKSYDQPRGDVFLLDKDGSRFWQVTDFSEIIAGGYISEAGSWSPDSTKLVVSVQSIQGENRIRSFIIDLISHSTFEICYDYYTSLGIWSPDSDYFIPYDSQVSVIIEIQSGNYGSITAFNEIYPRWFSWLP